MTQQKRVMTFWANIYCGLRVGYGEDVRDMAAAVSVCQKYADDVGLCVTVTPTAFVYRGGKEPGVIVGLINYPRFPAQCGEIRERALELAERLREDFAQIRVSVMMPHETIMLGDAG